MRATPLLAAFSKIERAKAQIHDLNAAIDAFLKHHPYELTAEFDPKSGIDVWRYRFTAEIPDDVLNIAAEALHSIRTPLDKALGAIVLKTHASDSGVAFPFGVDEDKFKEALAKQRKLPDDAKAIIATAKPYLGGTDLLYWLNELDRVDKHRADFVPIHRSVVIDHQALIVVEGSVLSIGPRTGLHLVLDPKTHHMVQTEEARMPILMPVAGPPPKFEPAFRTIFQTDSIRPEDQMEVFTATPGTQFYAEVQPSFGIAFSKAQGFEREPVIGVLNQMRDLSMGLLLALEGRFFS